MVDWQQIEKDFISWRMSEETKSMLTMDILNWFKNRIELEKKKEKQFVEDFTNAAIEYLHKKD
jgi:hypothetical protein